MPLIFKQELAEQDLVNIWLYTFNEWDEKQADCYLDDLEVTFSLLAEQPLQCRERSEFNPPVRIHPHASHIIVYLAVEEGINIIRVLHERMDVDTHIAEVSVANE